MNLMEIMRSEGHEQVVFCNEPVSGLRAIIAIHDTTLGPALGGCRMWPYRSLDDAVTDALRLSRGMTYKNSAMGLSLGGGKAVIIGDSRKDKTEELFRAFGKFVHSLGGRYYTAEDVGISPTDMGFVRLETPYVAGLAETSGDPSPVTAYGVFVGMKAATKLVLGTRSLKGLHVAIQGLGHVGYYLAKHLKEEGARLSVSDIYDDRLRIAKDEFGADIVPPEQIHKLDCDIYSPCALGAVLNDTTIPEIRAKIVAGAANNQLAEPRHGEMLAKLGILYAPDFVINGGGVVNCAQEFHPAGYNRERAFSIAATIEQKLLDIFSVSAIQHIPTHKAAETLAEERIAKLARLKKMHL